MVKTKYIVLMMSDSGDWEMAFVKDSISKAKDSILYYKYPYKFVVKVEGDIAEWSIKDLYKNNIVYAEPYKYMKGWTLRKAINKIKADNNIL
jgi:hypothetical protein